MHFTSSKLFTMSRTVAFNNKANLAPLSNSKRVFDRGVPIGGGHFDISPFHEVFLLLRGESFQVLDSHVPGSSTMVGEEVGKLWGGSLYQVELLP